MNRPLLVLLAVAFTLAGCATFDDVQDRRVLENHDVSSALNEKVLRHDPLTLDDIIALSQKGVPGQFIVHCLKQTDYDYELSYADAARLQQSGVSEEVIRYLTAPRRKSGSATSHGMYQYDPVYGQFSNSYFHN